MKKLMCWRKRNQYLILLLALAVLLAFASGIAPTLSYSSASSEVCVNTFSGIVEQEPAEPQPAKPQEPETPDSPVEPGESTVAGTDIENEENFEGDDSIRKEKNVKTNDTSKMFFWIMVVLISAAVLTIFIGKAYYRNQKGKK